MKIFKQNNFYTRISIAIVALVSLIGLTRIILPTKKIGQNNSVQPNTITNEIRGPGMEPENMMNEAKNLIADQAFNAAKTELQLLIEHYPNSHQVQEAKSILHDIDSVFKAKEEANEQKITKALKKLRKKVDEFSETQVYTDKSSPSFVNYNGFFAYIAVPKNQKPILGLRIQYAAEDWLFIEEYIIKVDGQTFYINEESYDEIKTDNGGGEIWEWLDRIVKQSEFQMLKAVANGNDVKIRFVGSQYYKDKTITNTQKQALKNVLEAFDALGGGDQF